MRRVIVQEEPLLVQRAKGLQRNQYRCSVHLHELQLLFLSLERLTAFTMRLPIKGGNLGVNNLGLVVPVANGR